MSHLSLTPIPGSNVSYVLLSEADHDPGELRIGGSYVTPADAFREEMCSAGWTHLTDSVAGTTPDGEFAYIEFFRRAQ